MGGGVGQGILHAGMSKAECSYDQQDGTLAIAGQCGTRAGSRGVAAVPSEGVAFHAKHHSAMSHTVM